MDPRNIKTIMEWLDPMKVDEVRSFMGLPSYYKWLIKKFSWIGYPIMYLQRKLKKFKWIEDSATSFEWQKNLLTKDLVLNIVDLDKEFVVCTNSCKEGLTGVLMQDGYVVCCESSKINEHEKNYVTHDLELEVIIFALNMWRHSLLGMQFILMSDHSGLRYLFDQSNINNRKARQLGTLSEFDLDIRHIEGKE